MIDLIYDCDITMGLPGRDVDDGLALLHLLGSPQIRLHGITSTFGNSSIDEVHPCLLEVLDELGRGKVPTYRGASRPTGDPAGRKSEAAHFLAESVHRNPGAVSILATGSPTNLLDAYLLNPLFFREAKSVLLMGGITEPLIINGCPVEELNLASDPVAALYMLYAGIPPEDPLDLASGRAGEEQDTSAEAAAPCPVTVISANLCLQALLTPEAFAAFLDGDFGLRQPTEPAAAPTHPAFRVFMEEKILPWFSWTENIYGASGFHPWDATAAIHLTHPDLFESRVYGFRSSLADLQGGLLRFEEVEPARKPNNLRLITLPERIRKLPEYWHALFTAWRRVGQCLS